MLEYKLYQVKKELVRDFGFMSYRMMKDLNIDLNLENYDLVSEGQQPVVHYHHILDDLFTKYNQGHPKGYTGRSMSTSDIVELEGNLYYCDTIGWREIKL